MKKLILISLIFLSCAMVRPAIKPVNDLAIDSLSIWASLVDSTIWRDTLSMIPADTFYGKIWQYPEKSDPRDLKIQQLEKELKKIKIELGMFKVECCTCLYNRGCWDEVYTVDKCGHYTWITICDTFTTIKCDTLWR